MKKTVSINLGGIFFHINEDAYNELEKYLFTLKTHFDKEEGGDEVLNDVEIRISEIFSEKTSNSHQVIDSNDVQKMVEILGTPADFGVTEEAEQQASQVETSQKASQTKTQKKFYRDEDKKILGGVCAGLSHYWNIDANILRILFIIFTLISGVALPVYIILWAVIPKAESTSQKMNMVGEEINLETIEKRVKEEYQNVANSVRGFTGDRKRDQFKKKVRWAGEEAKNIAFSFGKFFKRLFSALIVLGTLFWMMVFLGFFFNIPFLAGFVSYGDIEIPKSVYDLYLTIRQDPQMYTLAYFGLLGSAVIPLLMLFNVGVKWFFDIKHAVKYVNVVLFVGWMASLISLILAIALTTRGMMIINP